jgi:hypothetical protein
MGQPDLISDEYRALQHSLHENPGYGVASLHYAPLVARAMQSMDADELLDYGAGKGRLGPALTELLGRPLQVRHYDPAIPEWAAAPEPCRFVACIDVLEHIEPERIGAVLDDLKRVTASIGVFTVHTGPAVKVLADGRNAHLIQQPIEWWLPQLQARFDVLAVNPMDQGFWIVVARRRGWLGRLVARLAGQKSK